MEKAKETFGTPALDTDALRIVDLSAIKLEGHEDPHQWSYSFKWMTVAIVSLMGFISPMGSSIIVPGSKLIDLEFNLDSRTLSIIPVSTYVIGLAFGPFVFAPASELIGRKPVYVSTSIVFVMFNIATAVAPTYVGLNILRLLAGAFGSTGPTLGSGSIGDMFSPKERGKAVSLYGLGPLLGPVVGNLIGGFIVQGSLSWRWLLWTLTIFSGIICLIVTFCLNETYGPVLLARKRSRIRKQMLAVSVAQSYAATGSNSDAPATKISRFAAIVDKSKRAALKCMRPSADAKAKFKLAITRPCRLLFTNPICAIFSVYMGFVYGEIFIFLTQHPLLFQRRDGGPGGREAGPPGLLRLPTYNWSAGAAGLSYLGLGVGFLSAMLINAMFNDVLYCRLVASNGRLGWYIIFSNAREIEAKLAAKDAAKALQAQGGAGTEVRALEAAVLHPGAQADAVAASDEKFTGICAASREVKPIEGAPVCPSMAKDPLSPSAATAPKKGKPEYRLPFCLVGMLILPAALLMFGWAADQRLHWSLPLLGSLLTGMSTILCFQTILVYLVDAFVPYSASATACCVLVRSLLAAVFPLFAESLYTSLGFGWGSTLLALVGLLGVPVPIVLFRFGEALRTRYKFNG
ncbi:MFS general substrate transporter [Tilletiaria anomala UBC 951]|uniref:MFS general substrate transporter n=1 Tax=Tilletiaria anomala (strain ATCC 24038 / CBS 436.72 / UBC 951) TaxID=1037660 RepID=A0A066VPV4_TILAU|nr:MFS general substrate transporter [Tilletiaria anomala UBC 951]KDN43772.1 MFS general substrate transporter [Tilletiaria anomala UBC 951]